MLYETLAHGRALPKSEIQLPLGGLWLEVSTYPIRGDEATPLGAVLVLEDRTAQKELAARKRQAEESQLLARVIARIADEIKNPLVSINTFVELIDERYDDPDFRKLFSSVVRRDVRRLRSEEHTSELQSPCNLVCRLLLEKKKNTKRIRLLNPVAKSGLHSVDHALISSQAAVGRISRHVRQVLHAQCRRSLIDDRRSV